MNNDQQLIEFLATEVMGCKQAVTMVTNTPLYLWPDGRTRKASDYNPLENAEQALELLNLAEGSTMESWRGADGNQYHLVRVDIGDGDYQAESGMQKNRLAAICLAVARAHGWEG